METARLNLEWTRVRSPISGRVSNALVTAGQPGAGRTAGRRCSPPSCRSTPMYRLLRQRRADLSPLRRPGPRTAAPTGATAKLPVYLGLANEDGYPHEGRLDFVDNQIDPNTGTIRTRAVFSNKLTGADSRACSPGSSWWATTSGRRCWCATPLSAPTRIGSSCWWLDRATRLVYRPVVPGRLVDGLRIVDSGLQPNERVVVNGLMRVRPGMKVAPTLSEMTAADSAAPAAGQRK